MEAAAVFYRLGVNQYISWIYVAEGSCTINDWTGNSGVWAELCNEGL